MVKEHYRCSLGTKKVTKWGNSKGILLPTTVLENLKNAGYQYEEAEITMIPENTVEITDLETAKKVMALYDALEDLDDSQNVYSNFDISDEILEQLD